LFRSFAVADSNYRGRSCYESTSAYESLVNFSKLAVNALSTLVLSDDVSESSVLSLARYFIFFDSRSVEVDSIFF